MHQNRCEIRLILISMKLGQHVAAPLQPPYKSHQKPSNGSRASNGSQNVFSEFFGSYPSVFARSIFEIPAIWPKIIELRSPGLMVVRLYQVTACLHGQLCLSGLRLMLSPGTSPVWSWALVQCLLDTVLAARFPTSFLPFAPSVCVIFTSSSPHATNW